PIFRSVVGGTAAFRSGGGGSPHARTVEPRMDFAWAVRRKDQEPAWPNAVAGRRRRSVLGRRRRRGQYVVLYGLPAAWTSDGADSLRLAGQSHVRRLDADRVYRHAAVSRHEGGRRSWQSVVDGGGAGENGSLRPRHSAAAQISGPHRHGGNVGSGQRHARLRLRGAVDPQATARLRGESRVGFALSAARHDLRP